METLHRSIISQEIKSVSKTLSMKKSPEHMASLENFIKHLEKN